MESRNSKHEHRATKAAVLALAGSLAISGCNASGKDNFLVEVPDLPGCELPPHQVFEEQVVPERNIPQHHSRNPLQRADIVALNFVQTKEQLGNFEKIHSTIIPEYGLELTIYSDGELIIDEESLKSTFSMPFRVDYGLPRLDGTMRCIEDSLLERSLEGHELRSYISADPRNCINNLQLNHRGVTPSGHRGECHATGGSVPWEVKEISMLQDIFVLVPGVSPVVIAPGAISEGEYPKELFELPTDHPDYPRVDNDPNRNMLRTWIHEISHAKRWAHGAEFSILDPNLEEDLVKYIDRATMSYIDSLDAYNPPISYTQEALEDWGSGS